MNALDPKFAKILALMRSTQHSGERQSARARAEAVAATAGMTFEEAVALADLPVAPPNIFAGFDDWREKREPGWKAEQRAERAEKERARVARRAAILARYGSKEAALAPCARERMLWVSLSPLRKPCEPPWQRWTCSVDGYDFFKPLSADVRKAITEAYPMPTTFSDAVAEYDYWTSRRQDLEDVLGPGNYGDSGLDLVADIRIDLIRDLVEHEIETKTLVELHARFSFYRDMEVADKKIEDALFRDLEALVAKADLSNASTHANADPSTTGGLVMAALQNDPLRSDRDIARAYGCSPTTVGKARRAMGIHQAIRSVHRGEQMFDMHFTSEAKA